MERRQWEQKLFDQFEINPIVAILGPRQCGKTTLARALMARHKKQFSFHYFDLENPIDLSRLDAPMPIFEELNGIIIIDEIQRRPELFPLLRVLVDANPNRWFLILGSASRDLLQQSSETLAGRISYLELPPFSLQEVDQSSLLWLRGGFPKSYLAKTESQSYEWREAYISTYLERDIPNLGFAIPEKMLRRFWMMLTHCHGNIFNASEVGSSMGVSHTTARRYLDILTGTFMVRELLPWHENISKRQVKQPKIYFRDSGILHALLGIEDKEALLHHPKMGASWEGFAMEELIRHYEAKAEEVYFWSVHAQVELDLFIHRRGKRLGFEIKFTDRPQVTKSMTQAVELLKLDELKVIIPGAHSFALTSTIRVVGIEALAQD